MGDMDDARIVGVGMSEQARDLSHRSGFSVALESLKQALDEAGMSVEEIDGFGSNVTGWPGGGGGNYWAYQLKREFKWTGGAGLADIAMAARLITSGYLNTVAIVLGMVRPPNLLNPPWTESHSEFTGWTGAVPVQPTQFGLVAQRYAYEVPGAIDAMAELAASTRNYGSINPDAVYFNRGPFTAQDVLDSRMIASPLTLLMCSTVNDGGCAMILTHKDRAKDTPKPPIRVIAGASHVAYPAYHEPPALEGYHAAGRHYRDTMARAGVNPAEDINMVEFYDHFASHVLMQYEQFGFCGKGEAPDLVKSGEMKLGGRFPTCTDGGNLSFSHPGAPILHRPIEGVRQLRGEVKDLCPGWATGDHSYDPALCRKVREPKLAFASNPGTPTIQGSMLVLGAE